MYLFHLVELCPYGDTECATHTRAGPIKYCVQIQIGMQEGYMNIRYTLSNLQTIRKKIKLGNSHVNGLGPVNPLAVKKTMETINGIYFVKLDYAAFSLSSIFFPFCT